MKNTKLTLSIIALIFVLILGAFLAYGYYQKTTYKITNPIVSMEIEGYGTLKIELYPEMAPNTVRNFIKLAKEGYYNGLTFNKIGENYIQGGEKTDNTDTVSIEGEFTNNGYEGNTLKFEKGTIGLVLEDYSDLYTIDPSIAKEEYNSGYAKFFITTNSNEELNGNKAAFGKVVEGIEIIDKIYTLETKTQTEETINIKEKELVTPVTINNISVDTFGVEYSEPKTQEKFDINAFIINALQGMYN